MSFLYPLTRLFHPSSSTFKIFSSPSLSKTSINIHLSTFKSSPFFLKFLPFFLTPNLLQFFLFYSYFCHILPCPYSTSFIPQFLFSSSHFSLLFSNNFFPITCYLNQIFHFLFLLSRTSYSGFEYTHPSKFYIHAPKKRARTT